MTRPFDHERGGTSIEEPGRELSNHFESRSMFEHGGADTVDKPAYMKEGDDGG